MGLNFVNGFRIDHGVQKNRRFTIIANRRRSIHAWLRVPVISQRFMVEQGDYFNVIFGFRVFLSTRYQRTMVRMFCISSWSSTLFATRANIRVGLCIRHVFHESILLLTWHVFVKRINVSRVWRVTSEDIFFQFSSSLYLSDLICLVNLAIRVFQGWYC